MFAAGLQFCVTYGTIEESLKTEIPFWNAIEQAGVNSEINFSTAESQDKIFSQ